MAKDTAAFLLLGVVALVSHAQGDQCRTPEGHIGECISLRNCATLMSRLTSLQESDLQYLIESQCGFEGSHPKVCCLGRQLLPVEDCGLDLSNRMIRGKGTELDEYPWLTLLEYSTPYGTRTSCGGVLISKRYVLTAAHCLKDLPVNWKLESVRLGEYNTATKRDCIFGGANGQQCVEDPPLIVRIEKQIAHEDYAQFSNDIALLRLSQDVPFTWYIKPVCLPSTSNLSLNLVVAGWGVTETRKESDVKLQGSLPLVDTRQCSTIFQTMGVTLGKSQFCAGGQEVRDSCRGDSGGPLMQQEMIANGEVRWKVVGVGSVGYKYCGMKGVPGVYTKVDDYLPWIMGKLRP